MYNYCISSIIGKIIITCDKIIAFIDYVNLTYQMVSKRFKNSLDLSRGNIIGTSTNITIITFIDAFVKITGLIRVTFFFHILM